MSKICGTCEIRPVGGGPNAGYEDASQAKLVGDCNPCANEAQHEIAHLNGHESISEEECWFCHPELNEAKQDYTPRTGSSRLGIVLHVTAKASPKDKAAQVVAQLPEGTVAKVRRDSKSAITFLRFSTDAGDIVLGWDDNSRYAYEVTSFAATGGTAKKIRNVAQALRFARGEKS